MAQPAGEGGLSNDAGSKQRLLNLLPLVEQGTVSPGTGGRASCAQWWSAADSGDSRRHSRCIVQATAAEWALVLLAELRMLLRSAGSRAELVFFQHDEVLLHAPAEEAEAAAEAVRTAAVTAGRRLFGDTPVRFPMQPRIVEGYDER